VIASSAAAPIRLAAATHVGKVRSRNEDALVVFDLARDTSVAPPFDLASEGGAEVLVAVADGMGGHARGAVASSVAVHVLAGALSRAARGGGGETAPERLRDAVLRAHAEVSRLAADTRGRDRMGTTLTAVHVEGPRAHVAHVGDSRAYVLRRGALAALTRDHSFTRMLVDQAILDDASLDLSPSPAALLQVLGQLHPLEVDVATLELREDDRLLVCSDGLTRHLGDHDLERILRAAADPRVAADTALDVALGRGGEDNVTVIVASFGPGLPRAGDDAGDDPLASTYRIHAAYAPPSLL